MDKSWMSAPRGTTQYNDGCRAFVAFAVRNCRAADGKIYCPCKYCRNNQRHPPDYVLAHLTGGKGMSTGYGYWYMHGETTLNPAAPVRGHDHPSVTDTAARGIEHVEVREQGGDLEQGNATTIGPLSPVGQLLSQQFPLGTSSPVTPSLAGQSPIGEFMPGTAPRDPQRRPPDL
ncbi:uncharacterized protein LOC133865452 [Alnus glutinosa]|uniref:uncharacterized protein LOC133865452 n=1 Tax=Alnus glutinosa TaxID=3517 RepID=UPI002D79970D|nr:uncharacterized protein LOC133865452 [Alnus glutinosa]